MDDGDEINKIMEGVEGGEAEEGKVSLGGAGLRRDRCVR